MFVQENEACQHKNCPAQRNVISYVQDNYISNAFDSLGRAVTYYRISV